MRKISVKKHIRIIIEAVSLALAMLLLVTVIPAAASEETEFVGGTAGGYVPQTEPPEIETEEGYTTVVVVTRDILGGTRLNETFLETVIVRDRNLPDNIKTRIKDVAGKYVSETIYAGEYVRDEVLSNAFKPPINDSVKVQPAVPDDSGFIVVTDYIKASTGEDVAGALQKLIDKNWGKTLYFPDGEYLLSYPIQTSAVAGQTMSFILSPGLCLRVWRTRKKRISARQI